jgi:hypothetical protein
MSLAYLSLQRLSDVISRCDRILYKSTVIPPPDPGPELVLQESASGLFRSSQRVGQFLANAFKTRNRRESVSSISTTATNTPNSSTPNNTPLERRGSGPRGRQKPLPAIPVPMTKSLESGEATTVPCAAPSHVVHNVQTIAVDSHSRRRSTDPVHGTPSLSPSPDPSRKRSASGPIPAAAMASSFKPPALPMPELDPQPVPASAGPRRWFSLQLFSVIQNLHTGPSPVVPTPQLIPPVAPPLLHRKGDMVCIEYETLSDMEMRRLEGRSDHRPVIGHYAVFV